MYLTGGRVARFEKDTIKQIKGTEYRQNIYFPSYMTDNTFRKRNVKGIKNATNCFKRPVKRILR